MPSADIDLNADMIDTTTASATSTATAGAGLFYTIDITGVGSPLADFKIHGGAGHAPGTTRSSDGLG